MLFASRAIASSVMVRRGLWLCAWQADVQSKLILASYPFQGEKPDPEISEALNKILVETKEKREAMQA